MQPIERKYYYLPPQSSRPISSSYGAVSFYFHPGVVYPRVIPKKVYSERERGEAASKIQKIFKGYQERVYYFSFNRFDQQIAPFLTDKKSLRFKNYIISNINQALKNRVKKKSFSIEKEIECLLSFDLREKILKLVFRIFSEEWERQGSYKEEIVPADVFEINMKPIKTTQGYIRSFFHLNAVRLKMRNVFTDQLTIQGMNLYETIYKKKPEDVCLSSPLSLLSHPYYTQERYLCTLGRESDNAFF